MIDKQEHLIPMQKSLFTFLSLFIELTKPTLTLLVVISSVIGYLMGTTTPTLLGVFVLGISGYLVTASANTFNQIIEKELDKKMKRTQMRPLPTNKISVQTAFLFAGLMLLVGLFLLFYFFNLTATLLSFLSWFLYVMVYTPLKQKSSLCVLVGAFPGAFPPMLGYVAASGSFGLIPGLLFLMQFAWQFPHFWAIAWRQNKQYTMAGFKMLPLQGGCSKKNAKIILLYTLFTLPASVLIYTYHISGVLYLMTAILMSIWFSYFAFRLYVSLDQKWALKLMFASFVYLPVLQVMMYIDKL